MVVFRSFPFLPFLSLFSKLYLPSSSSFHLFIFASLHSSMDLSVTLSVLLINLLSPTAAIDPSIRTHSYPFTCFSVYLYDLSFHSFLLLFVPRFILFLDLIHKRYGRFFFPYSYFLWLIYSNDLFQRTYTNITEVNDGEAWWLPDAEANTSFYLINNRKITTRSQIST